MLVEIVGVLEVVQASIVCGNSSFNIGAVDLFSYWRELV
jgi:hypothetical protein